MLLSCQLGLNHDSASTLIDTSPVWSHGPVYVKLSKTVLMHIYCNNSLHQTSPKKRDLVDLTADFFSRNKNKTNAFGYLRFFFFFFFFIKRFPSTFYRRPTIFLHFTFAANTRGSLACSFSFSLISNSRQV